MAQDVARLGLRGGCSCGVLGCWGGHLLTRLVLLALFGSLVLLGADGAFAAAPEASAGAEAASGKNAGKSLENIPVFSTGAADSTIELINTQIRQGWTDNELSPSPVTDDGEFLRRASLDIIGRIPSAEEYEAFVKDKDREKRAKLIERLLDDPGYVRNWTTVWTNLCIGQTTPDRVSRPGMQKFFREAFGRNRPWKDIVFDIVTAEGSYEQNGAVNFLLAQMQDDDDGVQMTAKTTRLFLGMQVQCTQCHNHPFNKWKQDQFWQFNSFFRQTRKIDHRKLDPKTGREVDDYSEVVWKDFDGPVYFEKRSGLMQVAFPIYFGEEVDAGPATERRKELGRLMLSGERPLIADAMVNRMWGHFFGFGFTRPIDDMGPHNPPTHPELLEKLSAEFVRSGYDVKQLVRWIANSEAYNLTSRAGKSNERDNPGAGEAAQFSHMYVKPMSAEQLYDSLIVATNAHKSGRAGWEESEKQRQVWLQQFVRTFGTDDGEESNSFDGSIPQALMMMNGELVKDAVSLKPGSYLADVLAAPGNETTKIQNLFYSVLSRAPSRNEVTSLQQLVRTSRDPAGVFQDLLWALLNSNEFILIH